MLVGMRSAGVGGSWRLKRMLSLDAFGVAGLRWVVICEGQRLRGCWRRRGF